MGIGTIIHKGYEYITKYEKNVQYNSPSREDYVVVEEETWTTYRKKADGTDELMRFKIKEESSGMICYEEVEYPNLDLILASIVSEYGINVLLGDLSEYFPSLANDCPIHRAFKTGAVDILKMNLESSDTEKASAVQKAVELLINDGYKKEKAKSIVNDFTFALGWQLS